MRLILSTLCSIVTTAAFAHPSIVPHQHPHGVSALPSVETVLLVMFTVGALVALRRLMRK